MGNAAELVFTIEFDEYTAWEVKQKGWFACVFARLSDGREVPLSFWDPIRLAQETQSTFESGQGYFAEPGTIIS